MEMEMELRCGHYVGPGYVSNWGIQNNTMRRRHRTGEAPPSTVVLGNRKHLKSGVWTESEMKRKRRVAKYKLSETEKDVKGSIKREIRWLKNKYRKKIHKC